MTCGRERGGTWRDRDNGWGGLEKEESEVRTVESRRCREVVLGRGIDGMDSAAQRSSRHVCVCVCACVFCLCECAQRSPVTWGLEMVGEGHARPPMISRLALHAIKGSQGRGGPGIPQGVIQLCKTSRAHRPEPCHTCLCPCVGLSALPEVQWCRLPARSAWVPWWVPGGPQCPRDSPPASLSSTNHVLFSPFM